MMLFVGSAALADPPYPPPNVMLQFTCLLIEPLGDGAGGASEVGPLLRTERILGGRSATHHLMLSDSRFIEIQERLATPEECAAVPRDQISWVSRPDGAATAEFCITEVPGLYDGNVAVRISVPRLRNDHERAVAASIWFISSCKINQGTIFRQGAPFYMGRNLLMPRRPQTR
jgi:hypothetical protein